MKSFFKAISISCLISILISGCLADQKGGGAALFAPSSGGAGASGPAVSPVAPPSDERGTDTSDTSGSTAYSGETSIPRFDGEMAVRSADATGVIDPRAEPSRIKGGLALYERAEANPDGLDRVLNPTTPDALMIFEQERPRDTRFLIKVVYADGSTRVAFGGQARLVYTPAGDTSWSAKRYFDVSVKPPVGPDGTFIDGPNAVFKQVTLSEQGSFKLYYARKTDAAGEWVVPADTGPFGQPFASAADFSSFEADSEYDYIGTLQVVFPTPEFYRVKDLIERTSPAITGPKLPSLP